MTLHSGKGRSIGHMNRKTQGSASGGTALSAPTLTRTSTVSASPMTVDIGIPVDWNSATGTITGIMQRTTDPTFATAIQETSNTIIGGTTTYAWGFAGDARTPLYARWFGYQGAVRPSVPNYSNIQGAGDTTAPTITSSSTISLSSGVAANLSLTANEIVTWAVTGGTDAAQYSLVGTTLTCAAQTVGGSYAVQVTATDLCGNTTNQTITATLTIIEFSTAATDKEGLLAASGTPKLTITGTSGVGSQMNCRLNFSPTPDKVVWQITPTLDGAGDIVSFGAEDTTSDFSAFGNSIGLSNSKGIRLNIDNAGGCSLDYGTAEPQSSLGGAHAAGDAYMHEFQVSTGSHSFYRVRSGVKTQLGTTVSGLSATFKRGFVCMKNGSVIVANVGGSAWAATPTSGFSAYNT